MNTCDGVPCPPGCTLCSNVQDLPAKSINEMTRAELMERFQNICPGREYDSCSPCSYHQFIGGCSHPDQPDNIIAKRVRDKILAETPGRS